MKDVLLRVRRNLSRPLPDLMRYLSDKIGSTLWKRSIRRVGRGFHVCSGALIQGGQHISIGNGFYAGRLLWIEAVSEYAGVTYNPVIDIGDGVTCSQSVHIAANRSVTIADGVLFGSKVHVTDHSHGSYSGAVQDHPAIPPARRVLAPGRAVRIERNVWLGDGVVVLPGVTIGEGCVIGANSVVSHSLPPHVVAVGSPAIPIKRYDAESRLWLPIIAQK